MKEKKHIYNQMTEEERDRELRKILEAGYEEEAERIEAYAMEQDISMPPEEQERLHLAILKQVQQEREKEESLRREREEEQAKTAKKRKTAGARKVAVAAACVAVMIFGMSLTSEGNRLYLKSFWNMGVGDDTKKKTNNDEQRQQGEGREEEQAAREKIENALLVELPEFFYLPKGFVYSSYELDEILHFASIRYKCDGNYMWLDISDSQVNSSESNLVDGNHLESLRVETVDGSVEIELYSSDNETDGSECYQAVWTHKNVKYDLGGKMKKEDFYKILKKMKI